MRALAFVLPQIDGAAPAPGGRAAVHAVLSEAPRVRSNRNRAQTPALLKGLIFGPDGRAMSLTHTRKGQKLYRYYVNPTVIRGVANAAAVSRLPAGEVGRPHQGTVLAISVNWRGVIVP